MKKRSSKQPIEKKPLLANSELWREIPEGLQGTVRGGREAVLMSAPPIYLPYP